MLKALSLQNFALIDHLELQFEAGLHILSGDTGAGKSLLFDALHLLVGQKCDGIWVRDGAAKADIRCELLLDNALQGDRTLLELLHQLDLEDEENPCLVRLRRVIHRDGRSKAQINGVPVKASILKQVTANRVLFHDQHESMALLKPDTQLYWLDVMAQNHELLEMYQKAYGHWLALQQEKTVLVTAQRTATQRRDYLQFQLREMADLNLEPDYLNQLETRLKVQDHSARWSEQACFLQEILAEESESLRALRHWIQQVQQDREPHPKCVAAAQLLESAFIHLDEAENEVCDVANERDFDEELLAQAQTELSKVFELSRKHKISVSDLLPYRDEIEQELISLESMDERLQVLDIELVSALSEVSNRGGILSESRRRAVPHLEKLLVSYLMPLGMPETQWCIDVVRSDEPKIHGFESVQFLMSSNKGHRPQPLGKIASGGELSRVSLVLHAYAKSLAQASDQQAPDQQGQSQMYCFDEVDVGVSGQVAAAIGDLLYRLSHHFQVFCISHAPQVAAQKGSHWRAEKRLGDGDKVATHWAQLTYDDRVQEIARMLGTASKPELTLAKKLLGPKEKVPSVQE